MHVHDLLQSHTVPRRGAVDGDGGRVRGVVLQVTVRRGKIGAGGEEPVDPPHSPTAVVLMGVLAVAEGTHEIALSVRLGVKR